MRRTTLSTLGPFDNVLRSLLPSPEEDGKRLLAYYKMKSRMRLGFQRFQDGASTKLTESVLIGVSAKPN